LLRPVIRAVVPLSPGQELAGLNDGLAVALSPDVTYVGRRPPATQQIYLQAVDSLEAKHSRRTYTTAPTASQGSPG